MCVCVYDSCVYSIKLVYSIKTVVFIPQKIPLEFLMSFFSSEHKLRFYFVKHTNKQTKKTLLLISPVLKCKLLLRES